jgi:predicted dehydrogenase
MNIGIIGYGYTGQQHARAIAEIEGATLKAIADTESTKRSLALVPSYADYRSLLDEDSIEAISICLPHHLHEEPATAALLAGKHILIEKPLAISVSAGERLLAQAKSAARVLMVEMTHRFLPPLVEAERLVAAGYIGEILAVDEVLIEGIGLFGSLPAWMLDRDRAGGGVGLTSGIHLLDHISWITRQNLALEAARFGDTQELGNIEDTASFFLKMENGAPVHILLCWRKQDQGLDGHLTLVGSEGSLKVWPWDRIALEAKTKEIRQSFFHPESTIADRALRGMKGAIQEFVDAIREKRLPDPPADESLKSQAIIEQAYSMARESCRH